jgi:mannosyltransferase
VRRVLPPALAATLALAAVARLVGLGREGLWNDEVLTIVMSRGEFGDVLRAVRDDVHPPLHFLLSWLWQPVAGRSEWLWRLPSALCGLAAVGLTWRLAERLVSRRAAPVAALLAATSTMAIYYSQEARSYSLLLMLVLLALERSLAWRASQGGRDAAGLAVATALVLYTHYVGALALLVFAGWTALRLILARSEASEGARRTDWRGLTRFVATQAAALFAFVPWLWSVARAESAVRADFWMPAPRADWLPVTLGMFAGLTRPVWGASRATWGELAIGFAVAATLVAAVAALPRRRAPDGAAAGEGTATPVPGGVAWGLFFAWLAVPAALAYALSLAGTNVYSHRNLIVSLPAFWLLAAALVDRLPSRRWRALGLAAALAPAASGAAWYYGSPHKEQWRELAAEVGRELRPDDFVSIEDGWLVQVFDFHLGARAYRQLERLDPAALRPVRRLWLVRGPSHRERHLERVNVDLATLQRLGYRVVATRRFVGADLVRLERP